MGQQLMAIVVEGERARIYLDPSDEHVAIADKAVPPSIPETDLPEKALGFRVQRYGMTQHHHLFTSRQLIVLTTFSDLVGKAWEQVEADAIKVGHRESRAYADAVVTYLAFAISKSSHYWCALQLGTVEEKKCSPCLQGKLFLWFGTSLNVSL